MFPGMTGVHVPHLKQVVLRRTILATLALSLGALTACSGSSTAPGITGPLIIEGWDASSRLSPGGTHQLRAVATLPNGSPQTKIMVDAMWQTSDPTIATVSSSGLLTGVGFGRAIITATYRDMTSW